jgi:hypothetical protein
VTDDNVHRLPCPTCTGQTRETVGMVCQTCGTDYGPPAPDRHQQTAIREVHQRDKTEPYACDWCGEAWPCTPIRALAGRDDTEAPT